MFRKKNPSEENRIRLATESSMRDLQGLKDLCAQISERRGLTLELPWTTSKPSQVYILTVIWDKSKDDPVWTLYDEIDGKSTPIWSEPFPATNVELVYDILVMSTGASMTKATVPENLKAGQSGGGLASKFPPKASGGGAIQAADSAQDTTAELSSTEQIPEVEEQPAPQPVAAQPPTPPPPTPPPAPPPPQPAPMMTPQPMPPMPPGYSYPPNPAGLVYQGQPQYPQNMPNMPYPMAPGYPPMPPPQYMFPQQMGGPQAPNPSGFVFAPQQNPMNYPPSSEQQAASWASSVQPAMPIDASLLDKHSDILLGELLTRAELITEPTLEAALKIKDLVQEGKLSIERAPELLKTFFSLGSAIEEYVTSADVLCANNKAR